MQLHQDAAGVVSDVMVVVIGIWLSDHTFYIDGTCAEPRRSEHVNPDGTARVHHEACNLFGVGLWRQQLAGRASSFACMRWGAVYFCTVWCMWVVKDNCMTCGLSSDV